MNIWLKIAALSSVALALALRAFLPSAPSLFVTVARGHVVLPLNRLAFWACLLIALSIGVVMMGKAMLWDLGFR